VDRLLAAAFTVPSAQPVSPPGKGRFPNMSLTTHHGKQVRFYDDVIRGNKINIINMMYTQCPDVCGGALVNMARAQKLPGERMGRDVFMYSITLDPRQDSPKDSRRLRHRYQGPQLTPPYLHGGRVAAHF